MMDDTIYKISLAALLHDVGKFAERAKGSSNKNIDNKLVPAFYASDEYINNNRDLYQPHFNNVYTHLHAVHTAAFIDHFEKIFPKELNKANWGIGDAFINLAAGHHIPKTPLQWIVAIADRVSSGYERDEFDKTYNFQPDINDYKKVRLHTIFEQIDLNNNVNNNFEYIYALSEISPKNIFPHKKNSSSQNLDPIKEYQDLFFNFICELENLQHKDNISLWYEHFESLYMMFTSFIPSATVNNVIPDISLFDHSKITAAIASSLYLYHKENNTLDDLNKIKNYEDKKFIIVTTDFYGIQDFIFSQGGSTNKNLAKLLRGRSFYVTLLTELTADLIIKEIGLTVSSIILNAGGKITILAPNTDKTKDTIKKVKQTINEWLIKYFYGEVSIGIAYVEVGCNDLIKKNLQQQLDKLNKQLEINKHSKIDTQYCGVIGTYLDEFNNEVGICSFCGKRPANKNTVIKSYAEELNSCDVCHDQTYFGELLVKKDKIAIVTKEVQSKLKGRYIKTPIFDKYVVSLDVDGMLNEFSKSRDLLKFWNISIPSEDKYEYKNITVKSINGYVPFYTEEDNNDDRLLFGKKSDKTKEGLIDSINNKSPKTFLHIAKKALNQVDNTFEGIEALGVLKADIDNFGVLFACGLPETKQTFSRLSTLSRNFNNFFTVFLPYILKNTKEYKNIYTVFAGGDDLFLIGSWNIIIDFAEFIIKKFQEYVCYNNNITISLGISLNKPNEPVMNLFSHSEQMLELAKVKKDSIALFNESVDTKTFIEKLRKIKKELFDLLKNKKINNSFLYKLNTLVEYAKKEEQIFKRNKSISLDDLEFLKWRSMFKYIIIRNIGKHLQGKDKEELINSLLPLINDIHKYRGALKIPLWEILYNIR